MELTRRILAIKLKPADLKNSWRNQDLILRLQRFMSAAGGIGLSANQVGLRDRCFVMSIDGREWACFNPEIVVMDTNLVDFEEGCLSFKGESCIIRRPDKICVRYYDANAQECTEELTGLASRCFQHELDHLNGITMWDRYKEQNAEQPRD